jgi:hypothetical protein
MQTIYKILFEVRLLHEFYLTKQDGTVIFSKGTTNERELVLREFFETGKRSINNDISYSVPGAASSFFYGHKLKLLTTYSGFKIGIEVNRATDGAMTAFQPLVPLLRDSGITIFINKRNSKIDTYTNNRMNNAIKKVFYLSNESTGVAKAFPFLTNPVAAFNASYAYEQGELYSEAGKIKSFYSGILPNDPGIAGSDFLNETDRLVVTSFFNYSFDASDNIKKASFILKDNSGAEVYNNSFTSESFLQTVRIRIDPIKLNKLANGKNTNHLLYHLSVTGDGGYARTFQLIFLDSPSGEIPWAVININPIPADAAYSIIDNKGFLITRFNADGTVAIRPPVFEICVKSRLTFWRYINNKGNIIKNQFPAILTTSGNNLVTRKPMFHSYLPVPVGTQRLPNPQLFSTIKNDQAGNFSDIIVPISDTFPKGP